MNFSNECLEFGAQRVFVTHLFAGSSEGRRGEAAEGGGGGQIRGKKHQSSDFYLNNYKVYLHITLVKLNSRKGLG